MDNVIAGVVDKGFIQDYLQMLPEKLINLGLRVILASLLFIIGIQLIRLLRRMIKKSMHKASVEVGVVQFLDSCIKTTLYIILIVMLGAWFGIDATSVIAVLGSFGLTLGLAMQGSLANFAGGVLILTTKPFKVDDYIVEDTYKNEGFVTEIDLFYTRLVTIDNKIIIIPNGTLANSSLTNLTLMEERMLDLKVNIDYNADIKAAKDIILSVLQNESAILKDRENTVFVDELAENAIVIGFRSWVGTKDYWNTKRALLEKVIHSFHESGIKIPFQQLDIHMIDNVSQK